MGDFLRSLTANAWLRFGARRLMGLAGVTLFLLLVTFAMVHLVPGDPVVAALGTDATPTEIEQIRESQGFNDPLIVQFTTYVNNLLQGDLGRAFGSPDSVSTIISQRIRSSFELALSAMAVTVVGSLALGMVVAALTRAGARQRLETAFATFTSLTAAIPDYLAATLLALVFAVQLRWLPVAGDEGVAALVLPVLALSLPSIATLSRIVRVETLDVLGSNYVMLATALGVSRSQLYLRHVLPNVLTAALTIGGVIFANILGGAVIVEVVFARPGLGTALVNAVLRNEYVVVQGIVLVLGLVVVFANSLVDVALGIVDKRSLARDA